MPYILMKSNRLEEIFTKLFLPIHASISVGLKPEVAILQSFMNGNHILSKISQQSVHVFISYWAKPFSMHVRMQRRCDLGTNCNIDEIIQDFSVFSRTFKVGNCHKSSAFR